MFCFRRLRSCWKHPCGRLLVLMFLLSFLGLVVLPQFVRNDAVIRFAQGIYQETDQTNQTTSIYLVNSPLLPDKFRTEPSPTGVTIKTTITKKNNSELESTSSDGKVKNESLNLKTNPPKNISKGDQNETQISVVSEKFLFYLCDHKMYCYGIGDRQRGMVSTYLLAVVTNRTFGIIMTSPSNFTEFYKPNLVPWDIPPSKLKGKSSVELLVYGPRVNLGLHEIDFNKVYPQDIVYIRTNQKWQGELLKNHHYRDKFPPWAKVFPWQLAQVCLLRLMEPTVTLRLQLNDILANITQEMVDEYAVYQTLNNSGCCNSRHTNYSNCTDSKCNFLQDLCCNLTDSNTTTDVFNNCTNTKCIETDQNNCKNQTCTKRSLTTANENTNDVNDACVKMIENKTSRTEFSRLRVFSIKYCNETRPVLPPWASVESIRQIKGYGKVNLNLVCVHIRLGHSATMTFERGVRNHPSTVKVVWEFLKPYVADGRHVYLATDSQEVRKEAKAVFGDRVHVSSVPIAHIAVVKKGQDERSAFSLTLVEQLLLATSCKTLVISYSGFSMKAAQIRDQLGGAWELFMFKNGQVVGKGVKWLM